MNVRVIYSYPFTNIPINRYDKAVEEMDILSFQECPVAIDKTTGEITRAAAKIKEHFSVRQQKEHIR
jgi:hypothetical protein